MERLLARLIRRGLQRGLLGGSRAWLIAGAMAWVVRAVRRPESELVYRTKLEAGQQLVIDHLSETLRDHRRASKGRRPSEPS
jgi:hypothetical protein